MARGVIIRFFLWETYNLIAKQMVRYSISGSIAAIIDISALFILTEFGGINYLISAALSFCLGIITIYYFSVRWVFTHRKMGKKYQEFSIFVLIGVIGLALNIFFIWILTEFAAIHYVISKIIANLFVYFWNFFNRKYILFS